MALPIFKSDDVPFQMMQDRWAGELNPLLLVPIVSGLALQGIRLVSGSNTVNHTLGRKLQGWFLTRKRQWLSSGTPTVFDLTDTQDSNSKPDLTLLLYCTEGTSSNPALVDLWVY